MMGEDLLIHGFRVALNFFSYPFAGVCVRLMWFEFRCVQGHGIHPSSCGT